MDMQASGERRERPDFSGRMGDFFVMQLVNLALTVVTLGIYRFWAVTRIRRYLWSHTSVQGAPLEWAGTGMELFKGFLILIVLFGIPMSALSFWLQSLLLRGQWQLAIAVYILLLVGVLYLSGVAIFRMVRYRLNRTYWQGVRGGSDDGGWTFGLGYLARGFTVLLSFTLTVPWLTAWGWNALFAKMSFGSLSFEGDARWRALFGKYLAAIFLAVVFVVAVVLIIVFGAGALGGGPPDPAKAAPLIVSATLLIYIGLPLIMLRYAAYLHRHLVGHLSLGPVRFAFDATTLDWLKYYLFNVALVVFTLGLGLLLWPYRHWQFYTSHLTVIGDLSTLEIEQSGTATLRQGEGLADAFDIGAI